MADEKYFDQLNPKNPVEADDGKILALQTDPRGAAGYKVTLKGNKDYVNAGQAGGKTISGGSGAGENMVLESTSDVTKGEVEIKAGDKFTVNDFIQLGLAYSGILAEGQVAWDPEAGTIVVAMPGGVVKLEVGQKQLLSDRPKNTQGADIENGDIVYLSGATGAVPEVKLANASKYETACKTIAVATEAVGDQQRGNYTQSGIARKVNTGAFVPWDGLWLSAIDGKYTKIRPSAPNCPVFIGYVLRAHATEGSILVTIDIERDLLVRDVTKEPTGFTAPAGIGVAYDSNPLERTITLTGTINGYYRGVPISELTTGWVSDPHPDILDDVYFLAYNGTAFVWVTPANIKFYYLLIAYVDYGTIDKFAVRECHGLMPWQSHEEAHDTIGTYRKAGGTLGDYSLNSTLAADRRPSIEATTVKDEDLETVNPLLAAGGNYTQFFLSGASPGTVNFNKTAIEIVPLSTSQPYFNEFTGGSWQQTLLTNNYHMSIWLAAIPVTSDAESQLYRYIWVQGQSQTAAQATQSALDPNSLTLGNLNLLTPELIFTNQVVIKYVGLNWEIVEVRALEGTKYSQTSSPAGNFLSVVTSDATLSGDGTVSDPLSVVGDFLETVATDDTITGDGTIASPLSVVGSAQDPVISFIDFTVSEPTPTLSTRYINTVTGTSSGTSQSVTKDYIYEGDGAAWDETIPQAGYKVYVIDQSNFYDYTGSAWEVNTDLLEFSQAYFYDKTNGSSSNSGLNPNVPLLSPQECAVKVLAASPSALNRFAIIPIGAQQTTAAYTIPPYTTHLGKASTHEGSITFGERSSLQLLRHPTTTATNNLVASGVTCYVDIAEQVYAGVNGIGITLNNATMHVKVPDIDAYTEGGGTGYQLINSSVLHLNCNEMRESNASTVDGTSKVIKTIGKYQVSSTILKHIYTNDSEIRVETGGSYNATLKAGGTAYLTGSTANINGATVSSTGYLNLNNIAWKLKYFTGITPAAGGTLSVSTGVAKSKIFTYGFAVDAGDGNLIKENNGNLTASNFNHYANSAGSIVIRPGASQTNVASKSFKAFILYIE